ncbi:MAG: NAD(P)H-dependent oxidoreductase [Anaerolineales bacterium]|nr:NAD(P)H-dependent oxidoreductase [Anaerolineales bacterium]
MKIVAFNGSPRGRKSNTDRILLPFLEGARESGAETEVIYLKDKKIEYCLGCFTCWTKTPGVCVHKKDDMPELLENIRQADVVVYATPLYIFTVSGLMKDFMDRHIPLALPFIVKRGDQYIHPMRHEEAWPKRMVLISNCGFPERHHFSALVETFRCFTSGPDSDLVATILCTCGELLGQPALGESVRWYTEAARRAGCEVVEQGRVTPETQAVLDRPLVEDPAVYSRMANAYWNSVVARPEDEAELRESGGGARLPPPTSRDTMRDIVAGMALIFDPQAAGDPSTGTGQALQAVIQFDVSPSTGLRTGGGEPGQYYLHIAGGKCAAYEGNHPAPTLTIHTPAEVWLAISRGELDGAQAMMQGQYSVEGDLGLLIRFNQLFPTAKGE